MSAPLSTHIHYRCLFDLVPLKQNVDVVNPAVKLVRKWVKELNEQEQSLAKSWFFFGGKWISPKKDERRFVQTDCLDSDGDTRNPGCWCIRFEHQCKEIPHRQWRTDIVLERLTESRCAFSLVTQHWLLPGFFGEEPPNPISTTPKIVSWMLRDEGWRVEAGTEVMAGSAVTLRSGAGNLFKTALAGPERLCPIVYVSRDFQSGEPAIDANRLARLVAGTAVVYVAESSSLDKELEFLFPRDFRCWNGMLRVYQPGVNFLSARDSHRHRFFTGDICRQQGQEKILEQIVAGVCRRGPLYTSTRITSLEDLAERKRERILNASRGNKSLEKDQLILLFQEDKEALRKQVGEYKELLQHGDQERDNYKGQVEELSGVLAQKEYKFTQSEERVNLAEKQLSQLQASLHAFESLRDLPNSVADVVETLERVFQGRIAFTERGKRTAKQANLGDWTIAWKVLWDVATVLHSLYFNDANKGCNIKQAFEEKSGYELSLSEGPETHKDPSLMKLRKDTYNGIPIDITPHVKWGNKDPKLFRAYYASLQDCKLLVIGHCGNHLPTYSTRKRS